MPGAARNGLDGVSNRRHVHVGVKKAISVCVSGRGECRKMIYRRRDFGEAIGNSRQFQGVPRSKRLIGLANDQTFLLEYVTVYKDRFRDFGGGTALISLALLR